ncbi:MAG TPA: hypothetical protein VFO07_02130 [Roseiflexaceae bacterium]|nr:hypothetical protein [Roseiflexaceae bacterium]
MNRRACIFALTLIVALWLAGCGGSGPAATNAPASDGVPRTLHMIESSAEDIIDLAPNGSWEQVAVKVTTMNEAWQVYQPQAATAGASQAHQDALASALARVQAASTAKDAPVIRQAANDMGAAVLDLFALYNPRTPADIGRLDVFERQVVLDVAANDLTAAAASYAKTKAVWERVKPSVLTHNGQQVADKFEASLAKQAAALQAKDLLVLTAEANNGLEIVDELEKLY